MCGREKEKKKKNEEKRINDMKVRKRGNNIMNKEF